MFGGTHCDVLSREGQSDGHRHVIVHVQCFLVVNDVGVFELHLLHLGIFISLLVDELAFDGLELAVEHRLNR